MTNKKIRLQTILVLLTLSILSMAAHLQTASDSSSTLSAESHHPKMIESAEVKHMTPENQINAGNLLKRLRNIFGTKKMTPTSAP